MLLRHYLEQGDSQLRWARTWLDDLPHLPTHTVDAGPLCTASRDDSARESD